MCQKEQPSRYPFPQTCISNLVSTTSRLCPEVKGIYAETINLEPILRTSYDGNFQMDLPVSSKGFSHYPFRLQTS